MPIVLREGAEGYEKSGRRTVHLVFLVKEHRQVRERWEGILAKSSERELRYV
jgi:hypothetical protein